jgi:hypothetical protein
MASVSRTAAPNHLFREAGLLSITGRGEIDYGTSRAFAMCDHQVTHIYCKDDAAIDLSREILSGMDEVADIYHGEQRADVAMNCERAGDIVAFAKSDAWFEYRWWRDFAEAPDFAWTVDIHRKPGYDPTELFFDPQRKCIRADQPQLVKGSHGAMPLVEKDWPILLGATASSDTIAAVDVASIV